MLEDKVILVTGGARGIGKAISLSVAEAGGKVYINYRKSEKEARSLRKQIVRDDGKAEIVRFDVSVEEEVKESIRNVIKTEGRIDGLVNNAGVTLNALLPISSAERIEELLRINLMGTIFCSKHILKGMLKKGGSIVNITSVVGETGNPGQSVYAAAKGGIISFTKALAREVAPRNVRVNAVSPGYIESGMTESIPDNLREEMKKLIPMGRFGKAEEVARVVLFLLSDMSSYITGEVLKVNGGLYM